MCALHSDECPAVLIGQFQPSFRDRIILKIVLILKKHRLYQVTLFVCLFVFPVSGAVKISGKEDSALDLWRPNLNVNSSLSLET